MLEWSLGSKIRRLIDLRASEQGYCSVQQALSGFLNSYLHMCCLHIPAYEMACTLRSGAGAKPVGEKKEGQRGAQWASVAVQKNMRAARWQVTGGMWHVSVH